MSKRQIRVILLGCWALFALSAGEPVSLFFVRHAEKLDTSADTALSEKGERRAQQLALQLAGLRIDGLYCSPRQRTRLTLEPLARSKGLKLEAVPFDKQEEWLKSLRGEAGKTFVVCGHSDTIPEMIYKLGGPKFEIGEKEFDGLYMIVLSENTVVFHKLLQPEPCPTP